MHQRINNLLQSLKIQNNEVLKYLIQSQTTQSSSQATYNVIQKIVIQLFDSQYSRAIIRVGVRFYKQNNTYQISQYAQKFYSQVVYKLDSNAYHNIPYLMKQIETFKNTTQQLTAKSYIIQKLIDLQDQVHNWTQLYSLLQFTEYCIQWKKLNQQTFDQLKKVDLYWFIRDIYINDKLNKVQNALIPQYFFNSHVDFNIPLIDIESGFDYIRTNINNFFVNNTNRLWIFESKLNFIAIQNTKSKQIACQQDANQSIFDDMATNEIYDLIISSENILSIQMYKIRCLSYYKKNGGVPQIIQLAFPQYLVTLYAQGVQVINIEQCINLKNMSTQCYQHKYVQILQLRQLQRLYSFSDSCIECPEGCSFINALQNSGNLKYIQIIYPKENMILSQQKINFMFPQLKFLSIYIDNYQENCTLTLDISKIQKLEVVNLHNCECRYINGIPTNLLDTKYVQQHYNDNYMKIFTIQYNLGVNIVEKYFIKQINNKKDFVIRQLYKQLSRQQDCAIYRYNMLQLIEYISHLNESEFSKFYVDYFNNITHFSNQITTNYYVETFDHYKYHCLAAQHLDYCELNFIFNIDFRIIDFDSHNLKSIFNQCCHRIWHINSKINIVCLNEVETQNIILQRYIKPDIFYQYKNGKLYDIIVITRNNIDLTGVRIRTLIYQRQLENYEINIYEPQLLISVHLKHVKILNMSKCINLENIYSDNNTYYEADFISQTKIKRLVSFYDRFQITDRSPDMLSTLANCTNISFIQICYPKENIVLLNKPFSLNFPRLKYLSIIFLDDLKTNQVIVDVSHSNINNIQEFEVINGDLHYVNGKHPNTYQFKILKEKTEYLVKKFANNQNQEFYSYFLALINKRVEKERTFKENVLFELYSYFMGNKPAQQRYNIYTLINHIFKLEENNIKQVFQTQDLFEMKTKIRYMINWDQHMPFQQQKMYSPIEVETKDTDSLSSINQEKIQCRQMFNLMVPIYYRNMQQFRKTDEQTITNDAVKSAFKHFNYQLPAIQEEQHDESLQLIAIRDILSNEWYVTLDPNESFFDEFIQRVSLYDIIIITNNKQIMSFQDLRIRYLYYQLKNPNWNNNYFNLKYPQFLENAYFQNITPINLAKSINLQYLSTQLILLHDMRPLKNITKFCSVNDTFENVSVSLQQPEFNLNALFQALPNLEYFHFVSQQSENIVLSTKCMITAPLHKLQWLIIHLGNMQMEIPTVLQFDIKQCGLKQLKVVELKSSYDEHLQIQFVNGEPPILV